MGPRTRASSPIPAQGSRPGRPDGTRIAFMSNRDGTGQLRTSIWWGADGQGLRRLTRSKSSEGAPNLVAGWEGRGLHVRSGWAVEHLPASGGQQPERQTGYAGYRLRGLAARAHRLGSHAHGRRIAKWCVASRGNRRGEAFGKEVSAGKQRYCRMLCPYRPRNAICRIVARCLTFGAK